MIEEQLENVILEQISRIKEMIEELEDQERVLKEAIWGNDE